MPPLGASVTQVVSRARKHYGSVSAVRSADDECDVTVLTPCCTVCNCRSTSDSISCCAIEDDDSDPYKSSPALLCCCQPVETDTWLRTIVVRPMRFETSDSALQDIKAAGERFVASMAYDDQCRQLTTGSNAASAICTTSTNTAAVAGQSSSKPMYGDCRLKSVGYLPQSTGTAKTHCSYRALHRANGAKQQTACTTCCHATGFSRCHCVQRRSISSSSVSSAASTDDKTHPMTAVAKGSLQQSPPHAAASGWRDGRRNATPPGELRKNNAGT